MPAKDHPSRSVIDAGAGASPSVDIDELKTIETNVLDLIRDAKDPKVQVEASRLLFYIAESHYKLDANDVVVAQMAISALKAKRPNFQVAKFARNRLDIKRRSYLSWRPLRPLYRMHDETALSAMLVGIVASAIVWIGGLALLLFASARWLDLVDRDWIMPVEEASPLAFAALVGSLVSLLSRVNDFAHRYIFDPFLVFVNSLLRPLIGTATAVTIYAVIESGIIQVAGINFDYEEGYRHIFWAFGFIAGFSERLADDLLARAESTVGGKGKTKEHKDTDTEQNEDSDGKKRE